jgi:post-segregation antitoxin (ccd killing protein)
MANLQVRNFPDSLHVALAERARNEGVTMSAYVTAHLSEVLSRPSTREWVERLNALAPAGALADVDTHAALDQARCEYDPDDRTGAP